MIFNRLVISFVEWVEKKKYPEDVVALISNKRDRINYHKKKLKRINKCLNGKHPLGSTRRAAKTHKYMINKLNKEIVGIKKHFKNETENNKK